MGHKRRNNHRRPKPPKPPKNASAGGRAPPATSSTDELHQEQSKTEPVFDSTDSDTIKRECNELKVPSYGEARRIMEGVSSVQMLENDQWITMDTRELMRIIEIQSKWQLDNPVDTPDALPSTSLLSSKDQKWPLSDDSTDELRQEQSKTEPLDSTYSDTIKTECEAINNAIECGDHTEALRIAKEVCLRHESSAFAHSIQSSVYFSIASEFSENSLEKQEQLKNAVERARQAVLLSPCSIVFAFLYASLLYEAKAYQEVVQECERALLIHSPTDPMKDTIGYESYFKGSTTEQRIIKVKKELQNLVKDSKAAQVGNNKKVPLVKTTQPNKSQQVTKMAEEERGKEIQEQVEEERILKQNSDSVLSQKDEKSSLLTKLKKLRTNSKMKNIMSWASRTEQLQSYFKSMSDDKKLGLLETRICDLRAHLSSFKDRLAEEIMSEAVSFAEDTNSWRFWACCCCDEKFVDSASYLNHIKQKHIGNLSLELQSVVPVEVDARWVETLVNGPWKPVDTSAAVRIIESQSKCGLDNLVDMDSSECTGGNMDCPSECSTKPVTLPSWTVLCSDGQKWPISDDSEPAEILQKVHDMFQLLLKQNCVAESHINGLMQYAMKEIPKIVPASQLLIQSLCQSPLGFCFLGVSQLKEVLHFLQQFLNNLCGLFGDSETRSSTDDKLDGNQGYEINERIVLCGDSSRLHQDERLLRVELMPCAYDYSVTDDGPSATSAVVHHEAAVLPESDSFLYWLSTSLLTEKKLVSWTHACDHTKAQGTELFQVLKKESHLLQKLCEKKCEYSSRHEALEHVSLSIYIEEFVKIQEDQSYVPQGYGSLLRKWQEELTGRNDDSISSSSKVELDVISNVLKESQSINANQLGLEETDTDLTCFLCDLKCGEDGKCKMQGYRHQEEARIKTATQEQMEGLSSELCEIDAWIMQTIADMKKLEIKLARASVHDYRLMMLPILKTFMRAQLEYLVDKDATEKAEAAEAALLAELELDTEKNINKGGNQTNHTQENSKNRKKKKDHRKQEGKVIGGNKQHVLLEKEGEQPDISEKANLLKQSEELGHKSELEVEQVRMLEDILENQRRFENEAKQKQLAKQDENTGSPSERALEDGFLQSDLKVESCSVPNNPVFVHSNDILTTIGSPSKRALEDGVLQSDLRGSPGQKALEDSVLQSDQQIDVQDTAQSHEQCEERSKKSHEELADLKFHGYQACRRLLLVLKKREEVNKEIQNRMDGVKELEEKEKPNKEIQKLMDQGIQLNEEIHELNMEMSSSWKKSLKNAHFL
ncbi:uncharacterized protein LOC132315870 [Cornus florida]|uniref:uncharacterized protein LOC132315870 n=1 Tax=Cornus florida TaxID=4283 RepID=UPI0028A021AB|nr:uncharacterized protein LOC132315870 [Cornus florida]